MEEKTDSKNPDINLEITFAAYKMDSVPCSLSANNWICCSSREFKRWESVGKEAKPTKICRAIFSIQQKITNITDKLWRFWFVPYDDSRLVIPAVFGIHRENVSALNGAYVECTDRRPHWEKWCEQNAIHKILTNVVHSFRRIMRFIQLI